VPTTGPPPDDGHLLRLALDARLFGRVRLLTIDAVVDVAPHRLIEPPLEPPRERRSAIVSAAPAGRRRAEAEVLLRDARQVLSGTT